MDQSLEPYSAIIKQLEKSKKKGIEIELLASLLNRRNESEIIQYLLKLEQDGVVKLQDNKVWLNE